ncbi:unnamed protein product [Gongylonema pulchrum]|uniref:WH2 domain-containing protein n=1 Tax=Gongylonema pulchrum TaxID=637853 RepID=A0A183D3U0_9BILA|nr:unnamed protein product [Gongylonema pulchrum]
MKQAHEGGPVRVAKQPPLPTEPHPGMYNPVPSRPPPPPPHLSFKVTKQLSGLSADRRPLDKATGKVASCIDGNAAHP